MKISKRKAGLLGFAATTLLSIPGFTGCVYGPGVDYSGRPDDWDGAAIETVSEDLAAETVSEDVTIETVSENLAPLSEEQSVSVNAYEVTDEDPSGK